MNEELNLLDFQEDVEVDKGSSKSNVKNEPLSKDSSVSIADNCIDKGTDEEYGAAKETIKPIKRDGTLAIFDKINQEVITKEAVNNLVDARMLIDGLLAYNQITMIYAPSNIGKTTVVMGMIHHILQVKLDMHCYYLDYDNGATTMKSHLTKIMDDVNGFKYISYDKTPISRLINLVNELSKNNLMNTIIVFDSLQHFIRGDISDQKSAEELKKLFDLFKALKTAGATVIIISHTTKAKDLDGKEREFKGLNTIKDNVDNMFYLNRNNEKSYILELKKKRVALDNFIIITYKHSDVLITNVESITSDKFEQYIQEGKDKFVILRVQQILRTDGCLIQKVLIERLKEDDDTEIKIGENKIQALLKRYRGKYWTVEKTGEKKNKNSYTVIDTINTLIDSINNDIKQ